MNMTARQAARVACKTKYLGKPCKHGHGGLRYVSTGGCMDCCTSNRYRKRTQSTSQSH